MLLFHSFIGLSVSLFLLSCPQIRGRRKNNQQTTEISMMKSLRKLDSLFQPCSCVAIRLQRSGKNPIYYTLLPSDAIARNLRYTQSFGLTCISDGQIFFHLFQEFVLNCPFALIRVLLVIRDNYITIHTKRKKNEMLTVSRARCVTSFSLHYLLCNC